MNNIGIDIGGTKVNIGLVNDEGQIIDSRRMPVQIGLVPSRFIAQISDEVRHLILKNGLHEESINSFGVGVPGTVDTSTGFVEYCPNLGWEDIDAGTYFKHDLGFEVKIAQDSRLAAWAESLVGAGTNYRNLICVTLGTGIGCGIILDGKIFNGSMNTAGEVGHTIFQKNGRPCNCGNLGCLERYTSGTAIFQRAFEKYPEKFIGLENKAESVFKLAYERDSEILSLIDEIVEDLAIGIANAVSILSPEAVILSGGLCDHDELIVNPLKELVFQYGYHSWARKRSLKILKAKLGSDAPMIGAALLYRSK
jgi:glucokinase